MALFSGKTAVAGPRHDVAAAPPPPGAMGFLDSELEPPIPLPRPRRPAGIRFDAELDLSEIDDRDRPGPTWVGRGRELSRSHLVLRSRRMCHLHRRILAAVHLIDDKPVPLYGRVIECEYDGDGLYRVELELLTLPERVEVSRWLSGLRR